MSGVPVQVPRAAASVPPSRAVPDTVGAAVFSGATGATAAVGAECASAVPPSFVAVTTTRTVRPTSVAVSA